MWLRRPESIRWPSATTVSLAIGAPRLSSASAGARAALAGKGRSPRAASGVGGTVDDRIERGLLRPRVHDLHHLVLLAVRVRPVHLHLPPVWTHTRLDGPHRDLVAAHRADHLAVEGHRLAG